MKRKLASLRLITSLILVICFLLHALRNSFAHAHQAKDASNFEASILKHLVLTQKGPLDAYATNDLEKAKKKKEMKSKAIGGRKLTLSHHDEAGEEENHHDHHPKAEKKLSGATKVNQTTSDFQVKRVHYKVKGGHETASHDHKSNSNEAFSDTDYWGPRSHPSKHH